MDNRIKAEKITRVKMPDGSIQITHEVKMKNTESDDSAKPDVKKLGLDDFHGGSSLPCTAKST